MGRKTTDRKITDLDFRRLLLLFDDDPEVAAEKYEIMRLKLVSYFRWHGAEDPQELADQVVDRLLFRTIEGAKIKSLPSYIYAIARNLRGEQAEGRKKRDRVLAELALQEVTTDPNRLEESQLEDALNEARLRCLGSCLLQLPAEDRALILRYYGESTERRPDRQEMAKELGIPMNALRIRVFRTKMKLADCVRECLRNTPKEKYIAILTSLHKGDK